MGLIQLPKNCTGGTCAVDSTFRRVSTDEDGGDLLLLDGSFPVDLSNGMRVRLVRGGGVKIASISSRAGEHSFLFRRLPQSPDMRDHTNSGGNIRRSDRGSVCVC